jgi:hypothetical protein
MGAAGTDNFCLRWNDFAENVSGAFKDLRAESDFFDVTLACSDSGAKTLQAHKVILSACSTFFKGMLRQQMSAHKHPNPYIYLRGVSYNDLVSVLDFIYNGEVNVAQEDLNSFLAVAEELQIKGLTNRDGSSASDAATNNSASRKSAVRPRPSVEQPPIKKIRRSSPAPTPSAPTTPTAVVSINDDVKEVVNIKDDPEAIASTSAVNPDESQEFGGDDYDESYDGYYEDDGTELGEGGEEGADGTKGLQRIRNNLSSAEDEFTNIMLGRHAAGKLRRAFTLEEYHAIISRLEAVKEGIEKPNFNDIKMLKMYSIATYPNGEKFLVKTNKKDPSGLSETELLNAERFIPIEKLFPFIVTGHMETKHGKRDTLMKRLKEMKVANAGRDTVLLFLSLCDNCMREREDRPFFAKDQSQM